MADYAKKKNDELAALCKERGLAHTGKKAELVKRLEDDDAKTGDKPEAGQTSANDNNATEKASTDSAPPTQAANGSDNQTAAQPSKDHVQDPQSESKTEQGESNSEDFKLGLQETTLDEEIAKRKKRAEKFGLDISQDETLKQLERAKRFGTTNVPGLLNQALPERAERSKKRGREGREEKDDRKRSRQRGTNDQPQKGQTEAKAGGPPSWMTDKDREAAERRKARFTSSD